MIVFIYLCFLNIVHAQKNLDNLFSELIITDLEQWYWASETDIVEMLTFLCNQKHKLSCKWKAHRAKNGDSFKSAQTFFSKHCKKGHLFSCVVRGLRLRRESTLKEMKWR